MGECVRVWVWMYGLLACAYARVAVLIQHASRHHIAITSLSGSSIFFDISHKRYDFRKNVTENKMCILLSVMRIDLLTTMHENPYVKLTSVLVGSE